MAEGRGVRCQGRFGASAIWSCSIFVYVCYTWILLWAEKSAGPQSGKIFRRIPKKEPES